jgi:hypothetical protein
MNTMNKIIANRKFAWVAGIILVALYFGPSPLRFFVVPPPRPAPALQQKTGKPSPGTPALPGAVPVAAGIAAGATADPAVAAAAAPPPPAIAADDPALTKFLGTWQGGVAIKRGTCSLTLAVRDSHDKDHPFAGFSTLSCAPTFLELLDKRGSRKQTPAGMISDMTKQMNPTTAILQGSLVNDAVQFQAKENFAVAQIDDGCAMSSLTLIPFAEQMQAVWKESQQGICQGGQLLLKKTPR